MTSAKNDQVLRLYAIQLLGNINRKDQIIKMIKRSKDKKGETYHAVQIFLQKITPLKFRKIPPFKYVV